MGIVKLGIAPKQVTAKEIEAEHSGTFALVAVTQFGVRMEGSDHDLEPCGHRLEACGGEMEACGHRLEAPGGRMEACGVRMEVPNVRRRVSNVRRKHSFVRRKPLNVRRKHSFVRRALPNVRMDAPNVRMEAPNVRMDGPNVQMGASKRTPESQTPDFALKTRGRLRRGLAGAVNRCAALAAQSPGGNRTVESHRRDRMGFFLCNGGRTMTTQPTVFVVDDDPRLRKSLVAAMEATPFAAKAFPTAQEFLDEFDPALAGCVILDLQMPGMNGLELLEHMRARGMELPVIVFSGRGDISSAVKSLKLGAVDFLEKPADHRVLIARVTEAIRLDGLRRQERKDADSIRRRLEALTARERELLELVAAGLSSKLIAAKLGLSIRTVDNHRKHLLSKMQAENTADLVRMRMTASARPASGLL